MADNTRRRQGGPSHTVALQAVKPQARLDEARMKPEDELSGPDFNRLNLVLNREMDARLVAVDDRALEMRETVTCTLKEVRRLFLGMVIGLGVFVLVIGLGVFYMVEKRVASPEQADAAPVESNVRVEQVDAALATRVSELLRQVQVECSAGVVDANGVPQLECKRVIEPVSNTAGDFRIK